MSDNVQPVKSFSVTLTKNGKIGTMTVTDKSGDGIFNNADSIKFSGDRTVFTNQDITNALNSNGFKDAGNVDSALAQAEAKDNKVTVKNNTEYSLGSIAKSLGVTPPAVQPTVTAPVTYNPTQFLAPEPTSFGALLPNAGMQSTLQFYNFALSSAFGSLISSDDSFGENFSLASYELGLASFVLQMANYLNSPVENVPVAPATAATQPAATAAATPVGSESPSLEVSDEPETKEEKAQKAISTVQDKAKELGVTVTGDETVKELQVKIDEKVAEKSLQAKQEEAKELGITVKEDETVEEIQAKIDVKTVEKERSEKLTDKTKKALKDLGFDTTKIESEAEGKNWLKAAQDKDGSSQYKNCPEVTKKSIEVAELQKQLDEETQKPASSIDPEKTKKLHSKIDKLNKETEELKTGKKAKAKEQELLSTISTLNQHLDNYNRALVKVFVVSMIKEDQKRLVQCQTDLDQLESYYSQDVRDALAEINARLREFAEKGTSPIKTEGQKK